MNKATILQGDANTMTNTSAGGAVVAHPLFQTEGGGSNPTSALDLRIVQISFETAQALNYRWHSRLPLIGHAMDGMCFGAEYDSRYFAAAIWSLPIARMNNGRGWYELRRMAICAEAPKNTASRMLAIMRRIIRKARPDIVRLISYQDTAVHDGTIYNAAGWSIDRIGADDGGDWSGHSAHLPAIATGVKHRWYIDL